MFDFHSSEDMMPPLMRTIALWVGIMLTLPTYTQAEAEFMLQQRKIAPLNAFAEHRIAGRSGNANLIIPAASDATPLVEYQIEISRSRIVGDYTYLIKGQLDGRPLEGLCRFDVHDLDHGNPSWFGGVTIQGGTPHAHRYNEEAVRVLGKWCACAEILEPQYSDPERLWHLFRENMKLEFSEQESFNGCLHWVNP